MDLISDLLLISGALAAGFYCYVLSRRLAAFTDAESGVGQVVASLSVQVDDLNKSIQAAREEAGTSSSALTELTTRAERVSTRLELMVASMHDIPGPDPHQLNAAATKPVGPVFSTRMGSDREFVNE